NQNWKLVTKWCIVVTLFVALVMTTMQLVGEYLEFKTQFMISLDSSDYHKLPMIAQKQHPKQTCVNYAGFELQKYYHHFFDDDNETMIFESCRASKPLEYLMQKYNCVCGGCRSLLTMNLTLQLEFCNGTTGRKFFNEYRNLIPEICGQPFQECSRETIQI